MREVILGAEPAGGSGPDRVGTRGLCQAWPLASCLPSLYSFRTPPMNPSPKKEAPHGTLSKVWVIQLCHSLAGSSWISYFPLHRGQSPTCFKDHTEAQPRRHSESPSSLHRAVSRMGWLFALRCSDSHSTHLSQSLDVLHCPAPSSRDSTCSRPFQEVL